MNVPGAGLAGDVVAFALALADDELVIGHRHSEWLGLSPFLEEDLATASIAQDEMGHARAIYAVVWPDRPDRDALVTLRPPEDWRCCALVEGGARPWERHLVRHLLYDIVEGHRWTALAARDPQTFASLAARAGQEEGWHRRHATELTGRLTVDHASRLQDQLADLWPMAGDLLVGMTDLERNGATDDLVATLDAVGLAAPTTTLVPGDRTKRSPAFADVHVSFTEVVALDPSATW